MKVAVTVLAFSVAALLSLGLVMLYSSSMTQVGAHFLLMQLVWCAIGLVFCVIAASLDYRWLKRFAVPLLALSAFLLMLVLIPHIGSRINGARRWFDFHAIRFQPSELAKLALIIALAWYGEHYQRQMVTWKRGIVVPSLFIGLVLFLIFVEPDRGTTILMIAVCAGMLLIAGVRWFYFIPPILAGAGAITFSILHDPLRMRRIMSWIHLQQHKSGAGYQAYQAMLALGSGGWTGLGLGNSRQKLGFVPEHYTDFILSIIGEELGAIATLFVVVAFAAIIICGIYIAVKSRDTFGFLLASGLTFLIGLQAMINIGVVTSTLPNKGMPLPFISYGGSNLLAMLTSIGLLFSIARQAGLSGSIPVGRGEPGGMQTP